MVTCPLAVNELGQAARAHPRARAPGADGQQWSAVLVRAAEVAALGDVGLGPLGDDDARTILTGVACFVVSSAVALLAHGVASQLTAAVVGAVCLVLLCGRDMVAVARMRKDG